MRCLHTGEVYLVWLVLIEVCFVCFSDLKTQSPSPLRWLVWCVWIRPLCATFLRPLRWDPVDKTVQKSHLFLYNFNCKLCFLRLLVIFHLDSTNIMMRKLTEYSVFAAITAVYQIKNKNFIFFYFKFSVFLNSVPTHKVIQFVTSRS